MSIFRFTFEMDGNRLDFTAQEISCGLYKLRSTFENKSKGELLEYLVKLDGDFYLCSFSQRKIVEIPPCEIELICTGATARNMQK